MTHLQPATMRLGRYSLYPGFMLTMMTEGYRPRSDETVIEGIPPGARIVRIGLSPDWTCFEMVVEHESFPELTEGMAIPFHSVVVRRDPIMEPPVA
jgi:hypothetical protein